MSKLGRFPAADFSSDKSRLSGRWAGSSAASFLHAVRPRCIAAWAAVLLLAGSVPALRAATRPPSAATHPAAIATTAPAPPPAPPPSGLAGWPVARVELRGARPEDRALIRNQIRVTPGSSYSRAQVEVDVRSIASLGRFISVRAQVIPTRHHRVIVRYVVRERPVITAVQFVGNRHVRDATLQNLVLAHVGGPVDPFIFQTDRRSIRQLYRNRGFMFCRVRIAKRQLPRGIVRYRITEGPRTYISAVHFLGNHLYPTFYLHYKMQTKSRWKLFWLIPIQKGILSRRDLRTDTAQLRDLWTQKGFLDCRSSYILKYNSNLTRVVVQYVIQSGPRYRIGKIIFRGNHVFSAAQLQADVRFRPGIYYDRKLIAAAQRRIADQYGRAGYIYSRVNPTFAYSSRPGVVNLIFHITEGETFRVGQVIIRGNSQVEDHVVRRAIRLYPGRLYDTTAVHKSVLRIQDTGLFTHAHITPVGHQPRTRDALVSLQQGQTGRFLIGAGVSTTAGLIGQISFEQKNFDITAPPHSPGEFFRGQAFKGNGQYFQILLEPGTVYQLYRVTFSEPYLWDSPYSFTNSAYYFTEGFNSYNLSRIGDRVTFGRRLTNHLSVTLAFRGEEVDVSGITDISPSDISAPPIVAQAGWHPLTSITPGIAYNSTDSNIFPTKGINASLTMEQYGAMGGDYSFTKFDGIFTWYKTVHRNLFNQKTVFMSRSEVGFIPWGRSVFFERFYAGGIGSLRGFTYQGVGPREGPLLDPVGGNFLAVTTAELNFPLYGKILRGVTFIDAGDVEPNVHFGIIRADAGVGIRVIIPFFGQLPLGIDLAYPIQRGHQDHVEYVSFAFGLPM